MNLSSLLEKQSQARNDKTNDHKEYVPVYEVILKIIKKLLKTLAIKVLHKLSVLSLLLSSTRNPQIQNLAGFHLSIVDISENERFSTRRFSLSVLHRP